MHVSIGIRWAEEVAQAERHASEVIAAAKLIGEVRQSSPPLSGDEQWWLTVFGAYEHELEDMQTAIAHRLRRTPHWKPGVRRNVMREYIKVRAILTVGHGLSTVWY